VFGRARDPARPHLAIEVVWTSGRIDKLEVYRKLGVREVWYWRSGAIQPYVLSGQRYKLVKRSAVLPRIDLVQLASFLDRPTTSQAIRDYRTALRAR
jgi:Uma2 family endonuclease